MKKLTKKIKFKTLSDDGVCTAFLGDDAEAQGRGGERSRVTLILMFASRNQYLIAYYKADQICFSLELLEHLKGTYSTEFKLHHTRCRLQKGGRHIIFICINDPINKHSPQSQQKADCRVRPWRNNELDRSILDRINRLCEERASRRRGKR